MTKIICKIFGHSREHFKEKYHLIGTRSILNGDKYFTIRRCSRCDCAEKFVVSFSQRGHPIWGGGSNGDIWTKWRYKEGAKLKLVEL